MKQVFISYQHKNVDFANVLRQQVNDAGFSTWIDHNQLRVGNEWRQEIDDGIKTSCALIVIISPAAQASQYVTYEWAFALGTGVKVIPVVYEQTQLHPRLEALQHLDFTNYNARPWDKLIESLKNIAQTPATIPQPQAPLPPNVSQKPPEQGSRTGDIFSELLEHDKTLEANEKVLQLAPNQVQVPILKKKGIALTTIVQLVSIIKNFYRNIVDFPEKHPIIFAVLVGLVVGSVINFYILQIGNIILTIIGITASVLVLGIIFLMWKIRKRVGK